MNKPTLDQNVMLWNCNQETFDPECLSFTGQYDNVAKWLILYAGSASQMLEGQLFKSLSKSFIARVL